MWGLLHRPVWGSRLAWGSRLGWAILAAAAVAMTAEPARAQASDLSLCVHGDRVEVGLVISETATWTDTRRAMFLADVATELGGESSGECVAGAGPQRLFIQVSDDATTASFHTPRCPAPVEQRLERGDLEERAWAVQAAIGASEVVRAGSLEGRCEVGRPVAAAAGARPPPESTSEGSAEAARSELDSSDSSPEDTSVEGSEESRDAPWLSVSVAADAQGSFDPSTLSLGGRVGLTAMLAPPVGFAVAAGARNSLPQRLQGGSGQLTEAWVGVYGLAGARAGVFGIDGRVGAEGGFAHGRGAPSETAGATAQSAMLPLVYAAARVKFSLAVSETVHAELGLGGRYPLVAAEFTGPNDGRVGHRGFLVSGSLGVGVDL